MFLGAFLHWLQRWWYESGWDCEVQPYQVTKHLLQDIKFDKPLKPNCFIPRVTTSYLFDYQFINT